MIMISCFLCSNTLAGNGDYERVSIIRLIATPEKYHNKKVYIIGWAYIGIENLSVCLSKESLTSKNCLWLDINHNVNSKFGKLSYDEKFLLLESFNNKKIVVRGVFDANDTGHLGGWSGGIKEIYTIRGLNPPKKESRN